MSIRILLADDHAIIRQGLHSLLEKEPDVEVVAGAATLLLLGLGAVMVRRKR